MVDLSERGDNGVAAIPWNPQHSLKQVSADEIDFSRGFLRSRPERWFPGFSAYWLPLAHSLGQEMQFVEVKPTLVLPAALEYGFGGKIDGEPFALYLSQESSQIITSAVSPGAGKEAERIILDYLSRRFVATASISWSSSEQSSVEFDSRIDPTMIPAVGAIKLTFIINNSHCSIWIVLGRSMVERLDGLWRREVHSQVRSEVETGQIDLEIAKIRVAPQRIAEVLTSGALVDLELSNLDYVSVLLDGRQWINSRLLYTDNYFGIETISHVLEGEDQNDFDSIISVCFAGETIDAQTVSELSQVNAAIRTAIPANNSVYLALNGEVVAEGMLCSHNGRWFVQL